MPPEERDRAHLWDMLDAAREIEGFLANARADDYERDRKLQLAVERLLEIIGEAGRRLSTTFREENVHIPWAGIIGLRNVLAHEYGEVRNDIIWRVATKRVPELARALERLVQD